jgi:hypothetical protein
MYQKVEKHIMANSMLPIVGLLIIGGVGYYYYNEEEALTDTTTTSQTPQSGGVPTTSNGSPTITTTTKDNKNYVDEWINPPLHYRSSDFKKFMAGDVDDIHQPFSIHRLMEDAYWINNSMVKLKDHDVWWKTSGGIDIQVAEGFKVKLRIRTENRNYFHNSVYVDKDDDKDSAKKWINNNTDGSATDEQVELFFGPGDKLEIDIDNEHSGAYVFGIKKNGTWLRGTTPNDEFYITMTDIKIRNPDYDPQRFATEFNAVGGAKGIGRIWGAIKGSRILVRIGAGFQKVRNVVGGGKFAGKIPEGTEAIAVANAGKTSTQLRNIEGVEDVTNRGNKIKLSDGYKLVDEAGNVVSKGSGGWITLGPKTKVVRIIDNATDISTGTSIFTRRNIFNTGMSAVGIAVVGGLVNFFGFILPETLGDGLENLLASCEDRCAESTDSECIEKCQEDKQETFTKIGLAVVGTILGLTLILKGPSSSKEAEEIYLVRG